MDGREHKFSRNGLERHKVDTLGDLKELEMTQTHELRKMALTAQIEMWRGVQYDEQFGRLTDRGRTIEAGSRTIEGRATAPAKGYLTRRADTEADED
jgi:hypothetical protein